MNSVVLRIHGVMPVSRANGPGKRFCIWVQGCMKNCPGCFNPETHALDKGYSVDVNDLYKQLLGTEGIEGISISGGEPMLQAAALCHFLEMVRRSTPLSVVMFSGWTTGEINGNPEAKRLKGLVDILISGPYIKELSIDRPLQSSSNQEVEFLTNRYTVHDVESVWPLEVVIAEDGTIIQSGIMHI